MKLWWKPPMKINLSPSQSLCSLCGWAAATVMVQMMGPRRRMLGSKVGAPDMPVATIGSFGSNLPTLYFFGSANTASNLSAFFVDGKIEWSLSKQAGLDFRNEVFEFNRRVSKLTKRKPVNIYLGYDSSHSDVFDVADIFKSTPYIADLKPGGNYGAKDLYEAGGVPVLLKALAEGAREGGLKF